MAGSSRRITTKKICIGMLGCLTARMDGQLLFNGIRTREFLLRTEYQERRWMESKLQPRCNVMSRLILSVTR